MKNESIRNEIVQNRQQAENIQIDDQKNRQNNIINSLSEELTISTSWALTIMLEGHFDSETNTWSDE